VGHVACTGGMKNAYKMLVVNMKGSSYMGDLYVDGRIICELVLGK